MSGNQLSPDQMRQHYEQEHQKRLQAEADRKEAQRKPAIDRSVEGLKATAWDAYKQSGSKEQFENDWPEILKEIRKQESAAAAAAASRRQSTVKSL